jgi:hypothetical protein
MTDGKIYRLIAFGFASLLSLSACQQESMYDKCFNTESEKLKSLGSQAMHDLTGYVSEVHEMYQRDYEWWNSIDKGQYLELDQQMRDITGPHYEQIMTNNLYSEMEKASDEWLYPRFGDPENVLFTAYKKAQRTCIADPVCKELEESPYINTDEFKEIAAALGEFLPPYVDDIDWDAIREKSGTALKLNGERWVGSGYKYEAHHQLMFVIDWYKSGRYQPLMSAKEAYYERQEDLQHLISITAPQYDLLAQETCNQRGLYD